MLLFRRQCASKLTRINIKVLVNATKCLALAFLFGNLQYSSGRECLDISKISILQSKDQSSETDYPWHPSIYSLQTIIVGNSDCSVPRVFFGAFTNQISAGLVILDSTNTNRTEVAIFPVLHTDYTNNVAMTNGWFYGMAGPRTTFWLPPEKSRYYMVLLDENGRSVSKTDWGKMFGELPIKEFKREASGGYHGYKRCELMSGIPTTAISSPLLLRECFDIKKAGKYQLQFEFRAMRETGKYPPYVEYRLPVNAEIEIEKP